MIRIGITHGVAGIGVLVFYPLALPLPWLLGPNSACLIADRIDRSALFPKVLGFDFATSYYSAMPGGLQDMLLFGEEAGGDVRALSLIHATRVMVIVAALPIIL